jgi:hypothetical protein
MLLETRKPSNMVDRESTRRALCVLAGLTAALIAAILLTSAVRPRAQGIPRIFAQAITFSSALAVLTSAVIWLTSRLIGVRSDGELLVCASFASAWFLPLLILGDQKSWLALLVWAGIAIHLACLGTLLNNRTPNPIPHDRDTTFAIPSFASIGGCPASGTALIASFLAQAGLWSLASWRVTLAEVLFLTAGVALAMRGWRMLRDSPSPIPLPVPRNLFRLLAVVPPLLVIFAWLPRGVSDGTEETGHGSGNSPHRIAPINTAGAKTRSVIDLLFPGVVLYPVVKSTVRLIAPPSLERGIMGSPSKPFLIPFEGVYWFWKFPGDRPPETAVVKQGSPAKLIFHSTDGTSLFMEAHQVLATAIDLQCCSAIEIRLENADSRPNSIEVELLIRNTRLRGRPFQPLGVHQLTGSRTQTLAYKIPRATKMQAFDELTVRVHTQFWRRDQSANIAIQDFALIPRI